jgi:hypothetical protein
MQTTTTAIILMTKHSNGNENLLDKQSAFHVSLGLKNYLKVRTIHQKVRKERTSDQ